MIDLDAKYPIPPHETWNVMDSTKLATYIECPRKFFFQYILGWQSTAPNNHLVYGEAIHIAMEHLLLNGYTPEAVLGAFEKFNERYRRDFGPETDELFEPKTPDRTKDMLLAYIQQWPEDHSDYEVIYTEIGGTAPVSPEWVMFFKMDSIIREKSTGRYGSLEHKTHGRSFASSYVNQFPKGVQIGMYNHVLYCLYGDNTFGVKINGLGILKTKFDFQRFPFTKSPGQMQAWIEMVNDYLYSYKADMILLQGEQESEDTLQAFQCRPSSCDKFYGCPYLDFCDAWPNPLKECDEPPMGFEVRFWDPRTRPVTHKIDVGGKDE